MESTVGWPCCCAGWPKRNPTWSACRSSRRPTSISPRPRCAMPVTRRCGTGRRAGTASRSSAGSAKSTKPGAACRTLAVRPKTIPHSRYLEAAVGGIIVGCLYLPNGNPRPGPKFDYKLRWMARLLDHAAGLIGHGLPVALVGDFNVIPTPRDVYKPERWTEDALFVPEVRDAFARLVGTGLDRRAAHPSSRRDDLYLLGLFPERLRPRCGAADRSPAAEPRTGRAAGRGRGRQLRARVGEDQRSRPGVDRAGG